jgi:hypothetical protein
MQLLGARYYLPVLGRFLTQDPIGHEGGLNLYAYCGDSPLLRVDPSGTQASAWGAVADSVQLSMPFTRTYGSQAQALDAIAKYVWPISWRQHTEYGGWITKRGENQFALKYLWSSPAGKEASVEALGDAWGSVAFWHTHPFVRGMPYPGEPGKTVGDPNIFSKPGTAGYGSNGDIGLFNFFRKDGYLISPFLMRRYDYASHSEPILSINLAYLFSGRKDTWIPSK